MNYCQKNLKSCSKAGDFIAEEVDVSFGDGINIPHGRIDTMLLSSIDMSPPIYILTTQGKLQFCHLTSSSLKTPNTFGFDSDMLKLYFASPETSFSLFRQTMCELLAVAELVIVEDNTPVVLIKSE